MTSPTREIAAVEIRPANPQLSGGMMTLQSIQRTVADYIVQEFLPGARSDELTDSTPLISGGILDSLGTLNLVTFLEDQFKIQLEPYEISIANLNTLSAIAGLVHSKL